MGEPTAIDPNAPVFAVDPTNIVDLRTARFMRELQGAIASAPEAMAAGVLLTSVFDQVRVTYRGETRVFDCYGDLQAAVLVDCDRFIQAQQDAAVAQGLARQRASARARRRAIRHVRRSLIRRQLLRGGLVCLFAGAFAALAFVLAEAVR